MSADDDTLLAMRYLLGHRGPSDDDVVLWRMSQATVEAIAAAAGAPKPLPYPPAVLPSAAWGVPVEVVPGMPDGHVVGVTRAQRREELLVRLRREEAALRAIRGLADGTG